MRLPSRRDAGSPVSPSPASLCRRAGLRYGWRVGWVGLFGGCQIWDSELDYLFEPPVGSDSAEGTTDWGGEPSDTGGLPPEGPVDRAWDGQVEVVVYRDGEGIPCEGEVAAVESGVTLEGEGQLDCWGWMYDVSFLSGWETSDRLDGSLWMMLSSPEGSFLTMALSGQRRSDLLIEATLGGDDVLLSTDYAFDGSLRLFR